MESFMKWIGLVCLYLIVASATIFAQNAPVPLVNRPLSPDTAVPGGPAFTLTVNGTGFAQGSVVKWNGRARSTTLVSGSQLTAAILASDIIKAHTAWVTVANPGGRSSNAEWFPVNSPVSTFKMSGKAYRTGGQSNGLATGDFNHDGKLDIAAVAGKAVSILLGNGDGTFRPHVDYPLSSQGGVLTTADFNHDGNLDLAVTNGTVISILLGNRDGTFGPHSDFDIGGVVTGLEGLVAGDFNGDGNLDLAASGVQVSVVLGNGDGTFGAAIFAQSGAGPAGISVGDFNRDGKLDLVTADSNGASYSVLLGNGDGTFQTTTTTLPSCVSGIATADFNGDGILDLAITHGCDFMPGKVAILLGDGHGAFGAPQDFTTPGPVPLGVAAGDFNNDGVVDLVVSDFTASPGILLGNGDGTFQKVLKFSGVGNGFAALTIGDANNDGKLDIFLGDTSFQMSKVAVMLQERP
jgi:hypothetical protein